MRAAIVPALALVTCGLAACPPTSVADTCNADTDCGQGRVCRDGLCTSDESSSEGEGDGCHAIADAVSVALASSSDGPVCAGAVSVAVGGGAAVPLTLDPATCRFTGPDAPATGELRVVASLFNHVDTERVVDVCGSTFELTLTLERAPGTCASDDACPGETCVVDRAPAAAKCGDASGDPLGTACASDAACDHSACVDGLCSALCRINADCSLAQVCAITDVLQGARVCAVDPDLALTPCDADAACASTGRACNSFDVGAGLVCGFVRSGTVADGEPCTDGLVSSVCASGLCDAAVNGACTRACDGDLACAGPRAVCSTDPDFDVPLCAASCARPADCTDAGAVGEPRVCRARVDVARDETVFVCDEPRGALGLGTALAAGQDASDCATNFAVDSGGATTCSVACVEASDCGGAPFTCGDIVLARPGGGTQTVSACQK